MSTPDPPLSPVALRLRRERVIEILCEHFARDHLDTGELEALIDRAHHASSMAELDQLLAGLPTLAPSQAIGPVMQPMPPSASRHTQIVAAIMQGAERRGYWTPARETTVVAFMGGVCLDFREAHLGPGITEVNVLAVMSGVEIIVPPGMHVESSGIGIMGGFEHSGRGRFPVDSTVPVLRISGLALLGGVEIREDASGSLPSHPGSHVHDWKAAKHQIRNARRELRDELRRLGRRD